MKLVASWAVCLCIAATTAFASTASATGGSHEQFKVFNALLYKNVPDLTVYGIQPVNVIYEGSLNDDPESGSKIRRFNSAKVDSAALAAGHHSGELVILDMETWGWNPGAMQKYARALRKFKQADPASQVGMFGFAPAQHILLYKAYSSHQSAFENTWQTRQSIVSPVTDQVDVLLPDMYTFSPDVATWVKVATKTVAWAREKYPRKPIYVFIWPQYYADSVRVCKKGSSELQFLPAAYWREELETLYSIANGVVVWSSPTACTNAGKLEEVHFSSDMPWFKATLEFMKAHNIH